MLEARNVAFSFKRDQPLLRDVSLAVEPGTFTAILGQNGCGKSTLLSLMTAARTPDAGEVLLDGVPIAKVDRRERARKVAFVSQHSHANRLTVFDSVLLGRRPFMDSAPTADDRAIVLRLRTADCGFDSRVSEVGQVSNGVLAIRIPAKSAYVLCPK